MVTRQPFTKRNGSIVRKIVRAAFSGNSTLLETLELLYPNAAESLSVHGLRIQPFIATHRNQISVEPFLLPKERSGGSRDVALVPLIRHVVDEALRAYARGSPHLLDHVGKTPISPYGSMGLSVSRWGHVDWDYIRDLDWRIFLPPEIGHHSGFKAELERNLTRELHKHQIHPVLFGKDVQGLPQVQFHDTQTAIVHGFHFFLIAMKPGFVHGRIHHDGGYSPHFAYFPEGSLDEHLESAPLEWPDLIAQLRDDYIEMFNQLSFNIFGESTGKDRRFKTREWYLHKAFKWYATLARLRGLSALEEDLLYQYEHFQGSEAELSYFARYRYYAHMAPSRPRLDDVDRDLARAASIAYARARNSRDQLDPLVGQRISADGADVILLETVPENYAVAARKLLKQVASALPDQPGCSPLAEQVRFADNLPSPSRVRLDDRCQAALIPAEWSIVFCDSYCREAVKKAAEENQLIAEQDIRQAVVVLLASLLWSASQSPGISATPARSLPMLS